MSTASTEGESQPRSKTWLIVVIAVVVLCCLITVCCAAGAYLYTYGDPLFGVAVPLSGVLV